MDDTTPPPSTTSTSTEPASLANASVVLGALGLLPVLPLVGSVAALVCGYLARSGPDDDRTTRDRARAGVILGWVGIAAPVLALFVYCVVLGYPFPIKRYNPLDN